jgi:hypothetical protein
MSAPSTDPVAYKVSYSERVRQELRALISRATAIGRGEEVLQAVQEMDRRLQIYPQFGEPLQNLNLKPLQIWVGVVPPLVVKYVLDEERKQVMIGVPIMPLPKSGL